MDSEHTPPVWAAHAEFASKGPISPCACVGGSHTGGCKEETDLNKYFWGPVRSGHRLSKNKADIAKNIAINPRKHHLSSVYLLMLWSSAVSEIFAQMDSKLVLVALLAHQHRPLCSEHCVRRCECNQTQSSSSRGTSPDPPKSYMSPHS